MTINDLRNFAKSEPNSPFQFRRFTPADAASILEDHEAILRAEVAKVELFEAFDLTEHVRRAEDKADVRREFARRAVL